MMYPSYNSNPHPASPPNDEPSATSIIVSLDICEVGYNVDIRNAVSKALRGDPEGALKDFNKLDLSKYEGSSRFGKFYRLEDCVEKVREYLESLV